MKCSNAKWHVTFRQLSNRSTYVQHVRLTFLYATLYIYRFIYGKQPAQKMHMLAWTLPKISSKSFHNFLE